MNLSYKPSGVCSQKIDIVVEDDIIKKVSFTGGCNGNLQGIAALVTGMNASEAIGKLRGIHCGLKSTSCPDQLSLALAQAIGK